MNTWQALITIHYIANHNHQKEAFLGTYSENLGKGGQEASSNKGRNTLVEDRAIA